MPQILNDATFVIIKVTDTESYLGDDSALDGNGFVAKTQIAGDIVIPSKILGYTITGLKKCATRYCDLITSIKLPNTMTHLEEAAFTACRGLKTVIFPASIEIVEAKNDYFTTATKIYFEENAKVKNIGSGFLQHCYELNEFVFPPSVQSIGSNSFASCPNLKQISFCGSADLSLVSNPFQESYSQLIVLVTKSYTGSTFGGHSIIIVPFQICMKAALDCPTFLKCHSNHYSTSISL